MVALGTGIIPELKEQPNNCFKNVPTKKMLAKVLKNHLDLTDANHA